MSILAAACPPVASAPTAETISELPAAISAALPDLVEALEDLGVAFVVTPAEELDGCEYCPPADGPAHDGAAVVARRFAATRWTIRERVCPGCLAYAVRDAEAERSTEIRVEIPVGGAR
jgi:hypothetical protein